MGEISIPLSTPLDIGGGETISAVVLREPRMRELLEFGKPYRSIWVGDTEQVVEDDDTIRTYLGRLLIKPDIKALLGNLSLADGLAVREAFLGFFVKSEQARRARATTSSV